MSKIFLVSMFLTPFTGLFAPTSWNQMSKLFRFLKFFGKSNAKKCSKIKKLLLIKGVKSQRQFFFTDFLYWFTPFKRLFAPTSKSSMSKLFRFFGILGGKKLKEIVSDLKTFAYKGWRFAAQQKVWFSANFALPYRISLVSVLLSGSVVRCFVSCMRNFCCSVLTSVIVSQRCPCKDILTPARTLLERLRKKSWNFNTPFIHGLRHFWAKTPKSKLKFIKTV